MSLKISYRCLAAVLSVLLLVNATPALATRDADDDRRRRVQVTVERPMSMSEAIAVAKRQQPGKVLSAKRLIDKQGRSLFRIKILGTDGVVRIIKVDARSS